MTAWLCSSFVPHLITFTAEGDPRGSFKLQLGKVRRAICLMRTNSSLSLPTLQDSPAGPLLRAFCMRTPDFDEIVQTMVIKPQHSQLGQLIHVDAHLQRPFDRHFLLSKLYLEHVADLRYVIEPHRPFCFVDHTLVLSVFLSPRLA